VGLVVGLVEGLVAGAAVVLGGMQAPAGDLPDRSEAY
jgi:hypothetical protein